MSALKHRTVHEVGVPETETVNIKWLETTLICWAEFLLFPLCGFSKGLHRRGDCSISPRSHFWLFISQKGPIMHELQPCRSLSVLSPPPRYFAEFHIKTPGKISSNLRHLDTPVRGLYFCLDGAMDSTPVFKPRRNWRSNLT